MFQDLRDHNLVFAEVAARFDTALNLSYKNRSEQVTAEIVSGNYFDTLGLSTVIGRGLTSDDNRVPGGHSVAVLTYDYWKSRLGGDPAILNQVLLLNGHPMTVIGVAAPGYRGFDVGQRVDVLVPAMMKAQMTPTWNGLDDRRVIWLQLVGRLRPGVTVQQAEASLQPYYHALLEMEARDIPFRFARARKEFVVEAAEDPAGRPGHLGLPRSIQPAAAHSPRDCGNASADRLRQPGEPAVGEGRGKAEGDRPAAGHGREPLPPGTATGGGEPDAVAGRRGARPGLRRLDGRAACWGFSLTPTGLGITGSLDWRVFAFTFALALVTGVLFGLVPAWQATSPRLAHTLKNQAANVSAGQRPCTPEKGAGGFAGGSVAAAADRGDAFHALAP